MESFANDDHKLVKQLTNSSIRVDSKNCVINFKPGKTYVHRIKITNVTGKTQLIRIRSLDDSETFKFSNRNPMSIVPYGSCDLPVTFTSRSNEESKHRLCLTNSTGQENLTLELRAVPVTDLSSLPSTINFGHVDIGSSVTRKLSLASEPNPYRFRVFIPNRSEGLTVNPSQGEVFGNRPTDVTIVYTPQSYITLCTDLVFYLSRTANPHKTRVVTLTAETKPKPSTVVLERMDKKVKKKIHLPPLRISKKKEESITTAFNRINLNKMLMDKPTPFDDTYTWLNPLGEYEKEYLQAYARDSEDFMAKVKRWGDKHKRTGFRKIPRLEVNPTADHFKRVIDKRKASWDAYIHKSQYDFDPNPDDNWWTRFRTYEKFVNAVKIVIVKNRLEKRLETFKALIKNHII